MSHAELRRESHSNHVDKMRRMLHRESGGGVEHADKRQDEAMVRKAFAEHDKELHPGKHTKLKFADGGKVGDLESEPSVQRLDRAAPRARGGSAKHKGAHVNVIVAPQGGGGGPAPGLPTPAPMMAPPPRPPMPPPGGMPGGGAPGGMAGGPPIGAMAPHPGMMPPGGGGAPMMMPHARGGRTAYAKGGRATGGAAASGHPMVDPVLDKTVGGAKDAVKGRDPEWTIGESDKAEKDNRHDINRIVTPKRAMGGKVGPMEDKKPDGPDLGGAGGALGRMQKIKDYGDEADFKPEGERHRGGRTR